MIPEVSVPSRWQVLQFALPRKRSHPAAHRASVLGRSTILETYIARAVRFKTYGSPAARKASAWVGSASWTRSNCQQLSACPITSCPWRISAWVMFVSFPMALNFNALVGGKEYRSLSLSISIAGANEPRSGTLNREGLRLPPTALLPLFTVRCSGAGSAALPNASYARKPRRAHSSIASTSMRVCLK